MRPAQQTVAVLLKLALAGVSVSAVERTTGQLWVMAEKRVRIRE